VDIYSNNTSIGMGPYDITVTFGRTVNIGVSNEGIIEEMAGIRMSPHHFKVLSKVLTNAVEAWEAAFGEIEVTIPVPDVQKMKNGVVGLRDTLVAAAQG